MKILNRDCDYNLHTHTCYCDGKGTPAEIAVEARKLGFRMLGFSGHEYAPHDLDACMSPESTKQYNLEIEELKSLYQGVMEIHRGIERGYFGGPNGYTYDYVIGSVHYVQKNGVFICVDDTPEILAEGVEKHYGGDWMAMVEDYYALVGDVRRKTGADIIGHLDLVTKFNHDNRFFDENSTRYKKAALRAVAALAKDRPIFEINTGGMARGYRDRPYPADFILEEISRLGCPVILSSDCHDGRSLDFGFREVIEHMERGC